MEALHRLGRGGSVEGGGDTVDENEICFWNMHGQWNKKKGEGERVRQEIVQSGGGGTLSDGSTGFS